MFVRVIVHDNDKTVQTLFRQYSEFSEYFQNFQTIFRMFRFFSEFLAHKLVYSEFLDFVADSTYQSCYCLRVVKDMYVSKTFTAEYHYLKQRNFTFFIILLSRRAIITINVNFGDMLWNL